MGYTGIWEVVHGHTDLHGAYRCTGGIQMYEGHIGVWDVQMYGGVYRCMGAYRHMGDGLGAYRCFGSMYRYIGDIDVWGHSDIWGMYGDIQTYRGFTDIQGEYRCMETIQTYGDVWGVQMWEVIQTPPDIHRQPYPPHVCQLHLGTIFLIKFEFVPYRHILLVTNVPSSTAMHEASHNSCYVSDVVRFLHLWYTHLWSILKLCLVDFL